MEKNKSGSWELKARYSVQHPSTLRAGRKSLDQNFHPKARPLIHVGLLVVGMHLLFQGKLNWVLGLEKCCSLRIVVEGWLQGGSCFFLVSQKHPSQTKRSKD